MVRAYAAGFMPQERRYAMYQMLLDMRYTGISEVATFGPVSASTALDSQTKMEAILKQYPGEGEIDGVWCGWEEWAKGASRAIMEAGRADEIKVYGIDISDETLQMLQHQQLLPHLVQCAYRLTQLFAKVQRTVMASGFSSPLLLRTRLSSATTGRRLRSR